MAESPTLKVRAGGYPSLLLSAILAERGKNALHGCHEVRGLGVGVCPPDRKTNEYSKAVIRHG